MPLDPRKPRVITKLGTKKVRVMGSGNKHQITVVACASASGHIIPPMVIFEGKNLKREWLHNEVTGTVYAMSDKGWINAPLFNKWFDHFLRHAPPGRPLLLLLDRHSTHYKLDTISKAMKEQVIILTLPPTHLKILSPWIQVCLDHSSITGVESAMNGWPRIHIN